MALIDRLTDAERTLHDRIAAHRRTVVAGSWLARQLDGELAALLQRAAQRELAEIPEYAPADPADGDPWQHGGRR